MKKVCIKCGIKQPSAEFHKRSTSKDGLDSRCRTCKSLAAKKYYAANRDKSSAYAKKYYEENREKTIAQQKKYVENNREKRNAYMRKYYSSNSEKALEASKKWRQANPGKAELATKRWRAANPGRMAANQKRWSRANPEKIVKFSAEYRKANADKINAKIMAYRKTEKGKEATKLAARKHIQTGKGKNSRRRATQKRRALKLGASCGPINEVAIYEFCGNRCAYCGGTERLGLDHVVALAAGGAHRESNLLVACKSCNSSKHTRPVAEWLATRPMTRRAA